MLFSMDAVSDFDSPSPLQHSDQSLSQYLLVCQAHAESLEQGSWQFSLEDASGELVLEASDVEFGDLNRLSVMAALRGLEAIDGASSVTLLSSNRYLIRSLTDSLPRWRRNGFVWEHFGRRVEVQHAELWRRVDRALSIHRVDACLISSRTVSLGQDPVAGLDQETDADASTVRIDTPHQTVDTGGVPVTRRRRGHRPTRSAVDTGEVSSRSGSPIDGVSTAVASAAAVPDRLRRWLLTPGPAPESGGGRIAARHFDAAIYGTTIAAST
ncbi:ribonuclease H family protein [Crateriforma conspicua]|uniref:Ribonuclease HI n=1 Tax=Crateriforma conspicua TaxID=2527996 RepID=A0A5C5Y389_9PLAN|nr:hypothetical protein [Crateriforma conspicua]QDV63267.1 Ribonuclease HI [Crateriforma conspicua]TWT67962.1 Ribonuclease HI [Crateriforma conspicua]